MAPKIILKITRFPYCEFQASRKFNRVHAFIAPLENTAIADQSARVLKRGIAIIRSDLLIRINAMIPPTQRDIAIT